MSIEEIENTLNKYLFEYKTTIKFSKLAARDLASYNKEIQEKIIALLLKRGKSGALIKPDGIGEPLSKELSGFTKIKPKHLNIRIVYRPIKENLIRMEVIAIGPRNNEKVYKMAANRLVEFKQEMNIK